MGRPRVHDQNTAAALLAAAERLLAERGTAGLALREIASRAGTSVQAVYSVFGSKDALLGALGAHAMQLLHAGVDAVPVTDDPRLDLVEAALVFRRFALEHPALFEVTFQRADPATRSPNRTTRARALAALARRFEPLAAAGQLGARSVPEAMTAFHGLCEGLAGLELRGAMPQGDPERQWRGAFSALVAGFTA